MSGTSDGRREGRSEENQEEIRRKRVAPGVPVNFIVQPLSPASQHACHWGNNHIFLKTSKKIFKKTSELWFSL